MSVMDRDRVSPSARARLQEERDAHGATGEMWKAGRATHPSVVKDARDLPDKWHRVFQKELIPRLSDKVAYEESRKTAIAETLRQWRLGIVRAANRREKKAAGDGVGGLFGGVK